MILDRINFPSDLKVLNTQELIALCDEIRGYFQSFPFGKEGHKNSSIGVTELSIALHKVFETPKDILIWDVGHQAYVHKLLTGRKPELEQMRKKGGISGFTSRKESEYDPFGAGHSSTSISAALGFALGQRLHGAKRKQVAIIGDGAFTGGMCYEALNYLGQEKLDVLIVLNDNESSIDENVGFLTRNGSYDSFCQSLGIEYLGEVNGHNLESLIGSLEKAKSQSQPRLIRVQTKKPLKAVATSAEENIPTSFQEVFSETMVELATGNDKIVAITPAMLSGSGLDRFKEKFPTRTFDVGIAEQNAVTLAAGLAADGFIPVVHLYSTFSQRAYDQLIHDVALQSLHVIFCLDRAGLVGEDGATHHGNFDVGFLNTIPNLNIAAPLHGNALSDILHYAISEKGTWCIRYPKSNCEFISQKSDSKPIAPKLYKKGAGKAVLSFGAIGVEVENALAQSDYAHYNFPVLKPLESNSLVEIANSFEKLITVEENSPRGGFGDTVRALLAENNITSNVRSIALPDVFVAHGSRQQLLQDCGLDAQSILDFVNRS